VPGVGAAFTGIDSGRQNLSYLCLPQDIALELIEAKSQSPIA
jgi:hypothetical protein